MMDGQEVLTMLMVRWVISFTDANGDNIPIEQNWYNNAVKD